LTTPLLGQSALTHQFQAANYFRVLKIYKTKYLPTITRKMCVENAGVNFKKKHNAHLQGQYAL
jgi:hypothetical protein